MPLTRSWIKRTCLLTAVEVGTALNCFLCFSQQIIALLLKSLSGRQLSSIWALGLGSFSHSYYPGCDQLAVLLELKYHFGCEVYFQEPCLTEMEKVR